MWVNKNGDQSIRQGPPQESAFEKQPEGSEKASCAPSQPHSCIPPAPTPLTPHLCSCHHCGPAQNPHHRCSGTSQAGSHSSRTHRGFPECTHPHLWRCQVRPPCLWGPTGSVLTPATPGLTLAGALVFCGVEAHLAFAAVPAGGIKALPVLTEVHVLCTFVPV